MADKASRALVIYGDGLAPHISSSHSNLHSLATRASCGFLSLRHSPPLSESMNAKGIGELAQLLDAHDAYMKGEQVDLDANQDFKKDSMVQTISERFMELRAAIFTTCSSVESFGRSLGFSVLRFDELIKNDTHELLDAVSTASELLRLLGFSGGEILERSDFDLVFLHVGDVEKAKDMKVGIANFDIEWINALVGGILQIAQPGSVTASRLHFSVVMSFGAVTKVEGDSYSTLISNNKTDSDLSLLCPHQSYTMKGGKLLNDMRHHHPMLVAQWQEAVTRRDMAGAFSFKEFKENGGNLTIPADRFLHEVAFKLWKAPKYGA
ncbi:uncharacterized protein LOC131228746 isoform X2 [Magnolia sinica]|uniref:uncharacterized protein LOC131228746 isoform X2 n=1 Tax=Magnolia sinica TaxID=86752 RepID=UPI00265B56BE|nr:uncharacterized protein LOC131228746 isoform X2 [Magnolia sinica]